MANPLGHMSHDGAHGTEWTLVAPNELARLASLQRPGTSGRYRVDGPLYGIALPRLGRCESHVRRPPVEQVSRIGMDASKHIFQLHSADAAERPMQRRKLRHREMIAFF